MWGEAPPTWTELSQLPPGVLQPRRCGLTFDLSVLQQKTYLLRGHGHEGQTISVSLVDLLGRVVAELLAVWRARRHAEVSNRILSCFVTENDLLETNRCCGLNLQSGPVFGSGGSPGSDAADRRVLGRP